MTITLFHPREWKTQEKKRERSEGAKSLLVPCFPYSRNFTRSKTTFQFRFCRARKKRFSHSVHPSQTDLSLELKTRLDDRSPFHIVRIFNFLYIRPRGGKGRNMEPFLEQHGTWHMVDESEATKLNEFIKRGAGRGVVGKTLCKKYSNFNAERRWRKTILPLLGAIRSSPRVNCRRGFLDFCQ